jgi:hypothetical protein
LDYTSSPENNLRPGEANFARLREIYLETSGNNDNNNNGGNTAAQLQNGNLQVIEDEEETDDNGKRGNLRRIVVRHYLYVEDFEAF